jgi:CHAT domain-containing protein
VPEDERHFALGFDASRENVMDSQLHQYRIVHFATHGLIDSRFPALSALALSQFDANGRPRNGLLALHEIFDLRLNADLITLSACDTALGKEILGESLLGFTLGFRYAGAREVVATLWQVPDRASTEVMADFYQEFLQDNTTAATALRRAQLIVASQRRWADPFYWAAFVVQ